MSADDDAEVYAKLDPNTLAPEVAKVLFATEWDDAIEFFRAVAHACGMTHEEWIAMLDDDQAILQRMVKLPRPMTLEKSKPFVELSDMLTLARVARYCFEHVDDLDLKIVASEQ